MPPVLLSQFLAVFVGGGCGAVLRWFLSLKYNSAWPALPLGTLLANLSGGLAVGLAVAFFSTRSAWPPEARLFLITGLLGGLTTFSTFSSELVQLLEGGHLGPALGTLAANLLGSLALTALGLALGRLWLFR